MKKPTPTKAALLQASPQKLIAKYKKMKQEADALRAEIQARIKTGEISLDALLD